MARLRLVSWNVNGIRAVHKKGFLDWFKVMDADVVCIQETKAEQSQLPRELATIDGYQSFFASAATKKGYSGVAIYSRVPPRGVQAGMGLPEFDDEGRTLVADYGDFVLLNIYYPNGKQSEQRLDYKMRFYDAFLEYADNMVAQGRNVVVCGDVNTAHKEIDIARPKENSKVSGFLPEERAWMDKFIAHGYVDTFRMFNDQPGMYTWWDMLTGARARNVGWRIDYFFVNEAFKHAVKGARIYPEVQGSDHCPIDIELEIG
ncbi:MAG: exodeoxyribonuclease III [SAR202 cluster bacterium]|nr:exodeoxyribonuclease III [SAR202 cluster bacterium]